MPLHGCFAACLTSRRSLSSSFDFRVAVASPFFFRVTTICRRVYCDLNATSGRHKRTATRPNKLLAVRFVDGEEQTQQAA